MGLLLKLLEVLHMSMKVMMECVGVEADSFKLVLHVADVMVPFIKSCSGVTSYMRRGIPLGAGQLGVPATSEIEGSSH